MYKNPWSVTSGLNALSGLCVSWRVWTLQSLPQTTTLFLHGLLGPHCLLSSSATKPTPHTWHIFSEGDFFLMSQLSQCFSFVSFCCCCSSTKSSIIFFMFFSYENKISIIFLPGPVTQFCLLDKLLELLPSPCTRSRRARQHWHRAHCWAPSAD